jgi:hypothetical protein
MCVDCIPVQGDPFGPVNPGRQLQSVILPAPADEVELAGHGVSHDAEVVELV